MDIDILGICVTVFLGVLAIAIAIFFGLRGFTNNLGKQISKFKDDVVLELSGIKEKMIHVDNTAQTILNLVTGYLSREHGTVIVQLKNFGKTSITAEPGKDDTTYTILVEKGILNTRLMGKVSVKTGLTETEYRMFNNTVDVYSLGSNRIRLVLPSTDPENCTKYINLFLAWLDKEYQEESRAVSDFESGIHPPSSD